MKINLLEMIIMHKWLIFSLDLLNILEYEFYVMMNFKLIVNEDIYRNYYAYFTRD